MDASDLSDRIDLATQELDRVAAIASEQMQREQQGRSLDEGLLSRLGPELRNVAEGLGALVEERREWVVGSLELERLVAVGEDNLTVAALSLGTAEDDGRENAHLRLHLLCDATFHLRRCLSLLRRLDAEAAVDTRRVDRVENRRDFLSG